jgi:hypothetical protein
MMLCEFLVLKGEVMNKRIVEGCIAKALEFAVDNYGNFAEMAEIDGMVPGISRLTEIKDSLESDEIILMMLPANIDPEIATFIKKVDTIGNDVLKMIIGIAQI